MRIISRPRKKVCGCGEPVFLGNCGVKEHLRQTRTIKEPFICNGYVYIHVETGGMECLNS